MTTSKEELWGIFEQAHDAAMDAQGTEPRKARRAGFEALIAATPSPSAHGAEVTVTQPAGSSWTTEQFWEFAEGLTDEYTRDHLRSTMAERGLTLTAADRGTP